MGIAPGSRIGRYEVTSQLGQGGMGVVFRGRDSRLQRDVALKLLPDHFAAEPDRLSRFEREAQVLASLNHSNIAQIYGLEQVGDTVCIVMELVEGETLEERLRNGPLPVDDALGIARQIADALAAAHERGIVHRDLKPANIKLTPAGTVKVLDFGLAKAVGPRSADTIATMSATAMPTVASGSLPGLIMGTPRYMSPEQARGLEVDSRTDIWAFGCVLYEMLTARQAFGGETITDVLATIVTSPPDLDLLPKSTPPAIRLLLSLTLNKNSAQRLQHIGDARLFMDGSLAVGVPGVAAPAGSRRMLGLSVAAALALLLGAAALVLLYGRRAPEAAAAMRFDLALPQLVGSPILSPDGKSIAYAAQPADGKRMLVIRPIGAENGQTVAGTENIGAALWSPDSRRVAMVADGVLRILDLATGSSRQVGSLGGTRGGSWNGEGTILVARTSDNVIVRMADTGGPLTQVTKLDAARKEILHALPVFGPDRRHFFYVAVGGKPEDSGIFYASIDGSDAPVRAVQVQPNRFNGMLFVAPDVLLYMNEGKLIAQRVDGSGRAKGSSTVIADNIDNTFSASQTGLLLYHRATRAAGNQLLWFNREGRQVGQVGPVENYGNVDISPNGDRAAVDLFTNNNRDIWVVDLQRSVAQPVINDSAAADWTASWSPDGSRLAFASTRLANDGVTKIYEKSSTGAGSETVLPSGDVSSIPVHWSADGKYIVFSRLRQAGNTSSYDTWLLPLFGDRKPTPLLETGFDKFSARVSPNSNLVAYSTNESGTYQIVVQTFPDASGGKWQISADGGIEPKWRRDGRELYYLGLDGKMMAVSIAAPPFSAGRPMELFQTPLAVNRAQPTRDRRYDVAPDGRFLMVVPSATGPATPYSVVVNWQAGLESQTPE